MSIDILCFMWKEKEFIKAKVMMTSSINTHGCNTNGELSRWMHAHPHQFSDVLLFFSDTKPHLVTKFPLLVK